MAGTCIFKAPHSCGSGDGLQVFENEDGSVTGFCFACKTYEPDPLGEHTLETFPAKKRLAKTKAQIAEEIAEIQTYPTENYKDSKLPWQALDYFGIKTGFSEEDGQTLKFLYFPYRKNGELKAYKTKLLDPKRFWSIGEQSDVDLFGWDEAVATGSKRLIICEGELDCPAVLTAYRKNAKADYRDSPPGIVSLPHGAGQAGRSISKCADKIRKNFKEVILLFDNDEAGDLAVKEVLKVLPEAKVSPVPYGKDARDCLMAGKTKALYNSFSFNAQKRKTSSLVWGETLFDEAKRPAEHGIPWPFEGLTRATRGVRFGETWYIGAPQKTGKSVLVDELINWFIDQGLKVFAAKPEETNTKTIKMVAGKAARKVFTDPNIPFDHVAFDKACEKLRGNLALVNVYQNLTWDALKPDIIASAQEGCKVAIIDPITVLTSHLSAAEANTELQKIASEASVLAMDHNIIIILTCHVRNPESGTPLERGGKVLPGMFAGSRAMARSCNGMLAIEGNRDPSLPIEQKNMRKLVLLENRETGETGEWDLFYERETGCFRELHSTG